MPSLRTFLRTTFLLGFLLLSVAAADAATVTWVGGTGDWETAANWSGGAAPTAVDDVVIDTAVTVSINAATTINSLTVGSSTGTFSVLNFDYNAIDTGAPLTIDDGNMTVMGGGNITHTAGTTSVVGTIYIVLSTGSATIDPNGTIDTHAKGYQASAGPGNASGVGAGAGYGGTGGTGALSLVPVPPGGVSYGSLLTPTDLGSNAGGGAMQLTVAGTFTINGTINADGRRTQVGSEGGHSGGSVYITTGTLAGTGVISGTGSSATNGSGGGGGRIAIYYTTDSSTVSIYAHGGTTGASYPGRQGGAGTIFKKAAAATNGDLIVDNDYKDFGNDDRYAGRTPLTGTFTFDNITVRSMGHLAFQSDANITVVGTLTYSSSGVIQDDGGVFAPFSSSGALTIPQGGLLLTNVDRTYTDVTVSGTWSHSNNNITVQDYELVITADNITVDPNGYIDASGRGFGGGAGTGSGLTFGTASAGGGGGYGGLGGTGSSSSNRAGGVAYGSITIPTDIGSGGGGWSSGLGIFLGGQGGGAIKLTVSNTLTNNGFIQSDGERISNAGGSGGSVYITTGTLAGTGVISGTGGSTSSGGGGGGGRIAVYYTTDSSTITYYTHGGANTTTTYLDFDNSFGGAGTLFTKAAAASNGDLTIDNNNNSFDITNDDRFVGKTPFTGSFTFDTITVKNLGHLSLFSGSTVNYTTLNWSNNGIIEDNGGSMSPFSSGSTMTIPFGARLYTNVDRTYTDVTVSGLWSHSSNWTAKDYDLVIDATNITVDPNAVIDAYARGFADNNGQGTTAGNGGGGHGGRGGSYNTTTLTGGVTYGSATAPTDLGSAANVGNGGGAIKLTVSSTLTNNGSISADGQRVEFGGAGAGGSVYITTGTLAGTGTISGTGGNILGTISDDDYGGGGGGRIAIYYTTDSSTTNSYAFGGGGGTFTPSHFGGAGTIFKKAAAASNGDLTVDNDFQDPGSNDSTIGKTTLTGTYTFDTITVKSLGYLSLSSDSSISYSTLNWSNSGAIEDNGAGTFDLVTSAGDLTVPVTARLYANQSRTFSSATIDGMLTHSNNLASQLYRVNLSMTGNFTVNPGGTVDISERGYLHSDGPGQGADNSSGPAGAGYGGTGGRGNVSATGGVTYGTEAAPTDVGSGGGNKSSSSSRGGRGGGAFQISSSGTVTLNGNVDADGGAGNTGGGGSGGAIYIVAGTLAGTGSITADGGAGGSNAGGGGCGRIALIYTSSSYTGTQSATGGAGGGGLAESGSGCTIYTESSNAAPTISSLSVTPATNGSGDITFSFSFADSDLSNTGQAKVEYSLDGSTFSDPTISTTGSDTSATYGDPGVDNAATYQLGTASAYILGSSGANTVTSVWKSGTDLPTTADGAVYLRVTGHDGASAGTAATSSSFAVDNVSPTLSISTPGAVSSTSESSTQTIAGTTDTGSASILSNDVTVTTADSSGNFSFTVTLAAGTNSFAVKARDSHGNVSPTTTLTITTPSSSSGGGGGTSSGGGEGMAGEDETPPDETPTDGEETPPEEPTVPGEDTPTEEPTTPGEEEPTAPGEETPTSDGETSTDGGTTSSGGEEGGGLFGGVFGGGSSNKVSNNIIAVEDQLIAGGTSVFKDSRSTRQLYESVTRNGIPKPLIIQYFGSVGKFDENNDTDTDGVTDGQELAYGGNPLLGDTDADAVADDEEFVDGTALYSWDTDGDGVSDLIEGPEEALIYDYPFVEEEVILDYIYENDILIEELEGMDAAEGLGTIDSDSDGLSDLQELELKTEPLVPDTDEDSYLDGEEWLNYGTDPNVASRPMGIGVARSGAIELVSEGEQFFLGNAPASSELTIHAYNDEEVILMGETMTDEEGKFEIFTATLDPGTYNLAVLQMDEKGKEIVSLSYPFEFTVKEGELVESPILKQLDDHLILRNTTIVATWQKILFGEVDEEAVVNPGARFIVGQSSKPNSVVEFYAVLENDDEVFLGQTISDEIGKYVFFNKSTFDQSFAIFAYTIEDGEILDVSLPLLLIVNKTLEDELLALGISIDVPLLETVYPSLFAMAVHEDDEIIVSWKSLVLSSTIVTDCCDRQSFEQSPLEPLEPGRHTVTVYALNRETADRSAPIRAEFDVLQTGLITPVGPEPRQNPLPWIAGAAAVLVALGIIYRARRKQKKSVK